MNILKTLLNTVTNAKQQATQSSLNAIANASMPSSAIGSSAIMNPYSSLYSIQNNNSSHSTPSHQFANKTPTFSMFFYQAENGGFILELRPTTLDLTSLTYPNSKIFIINDVEHLGRDVQAILMKEVLKS